MLEEYAAKKAELVDNTPFESFENNLQRLMELYDLIENNPLVIKKYVESAIEPTNEIVQEL